MVTDTSSSLSSHCRHVLAALSPPHVASLDTLGRMSLFYPVDIEPGKHKQKNVFGWTAT